MFEMLSDSSVEFVEFFSKNSWNGGNGFENWTHYLPSDFQYSKEELEKEKHEMTELNSKLLELGVSQHEIDTLLRHKDDL